MLPAHHSSPARPKPGEMGAFDTHNSEGSKRERAPRRAAARRCAYHTEQKSLERTFDQIDPSVIAEVLASHAGNMEAAAMELVEYDHEAAMAKQLMNTSGSSSPTHAESEKETKANAEASFWDDVLGDCDVDPDGPSDGPAVEAGAEGSMHAAQALAGDTTPYSSWPVDQWLTVETNGFGAMTEDATAVEKLLGWRASVDAVDTNSGTPDEDGVDILVKWKGRALIHCSWVPLPALTAAMNPGVASQRLARFWERHPRVAGPCVAVRRACLNVASVVATRDRCWRPEAEDSEPSPAPPGVTSSPERREALVRWGGGLGYEDATWEPVEWVESRSDGDVALRAYGAVQARREEKLDAARRARGESTIQSVEADAELTPSREWYGSEGDVLRGYQKEGVRWMAHNLVVRERGCILADEMGLGKTAQSLALVDYVLRAQRASRLETRGPALVVVPLSTLVNWEREAARWVPGAHVVAYVGPPAARVCIRRHEISYGDGRLVTNEGSDSDASNAEQRVESQSDNGRVDRADVYRADVVLTTYEMVQADRSALAKIPWSCLVIDEAHRLKNSGGKAQRDLRTLDFAKRVVLLTGTPLQNDTAELWSLLNFVDAGRFASKDEFESAFGAMTAARQVETLHKVLAPYLLRRLKQDVEHKLPPRVETLVECELMPLQKKCYRALFERNFSFLRQGSKDDRALANFSNLMMEVRKCCQHPFLLDGVEEAFVSQQMSKKGGKRPAKTATAAELVACSGKLQLLDKLLSRLKAGGHRALIFSQMTRVLDVLEDYCRNRGHSYERLDGGVTGRARQAAIDRFCGGSNATDAGHSDDGAFLFLLSTRAGGQGINLVAADTVIVFDSDWNPQNDAQALARAHRIGQTKPVQVYRLVMRATYERDMLDRAAMKLGLEQAIFSSNLNTGNGAMDSKERRGAAAEIERLLKHGAYGALSEDCAEGDARTKAFAAEGIDDILARSERRVVEASDDDTSKSSDAQKSMFATATFTGEGGDGSDEIALDDPDFWQKLMPEAAEAERLREEKEAAEEAERLRQEEAAFARMKNGKPEVFVWTWTERKRVLSQLASFGYGQWNRIHEGSKAVLAEDKTVSAIAAFCRRFVLEASQVMTEGSCPLLLSAASSGPAVGAGVDERTLEPDKGGDATLFALFGEVKFASHVRQRALEEMPKLELLRAAAWAVEKVGGESAALASDSAGWLEGIPEVQAVFKYSEPPAPWWSEAEDRALIVGTLRHGWGRYDAMRADVELGLEVALERAAAAAAAAAAESQSREGSGTPRSAGSSKRKRSSLDQRSSPDLEGKENAPHNMDSASKRLKPGAVAGVHRECDVAAAVESGEEMAVPEWPLGRVLSLRLRRLCTALGGKVAVAPPAPKQAKPARGPRPPREKGSRGGGARATAAVGSMDKNARAVHQISLLTRGEDGKVVLPVGPIHGVTLESLGAVQPPDAPGFHSAAYILPVGYRTTRQYMRCDDPNGPRTRWVQEIVRGEGDDEGKPLFRLTADEGLDEPIVAKSATAAWAEVLRRVTTVRMANGEEAKKTAISGPEFFGYSLPHIRLLIEELPGVNDCTEYKPLLERSVTAEAFASAEEGPGDASVEQEA